MAHSGTRFELWALPDAAATPQPGPRAAVSVLQQHHGCCGVSKAPPKPPAWLLSSAGAFFCAGESISEAEKLIAATEY